MSRRRSMFRELLETAVLTIGIFLVVKVAVQNFKVEGDSMQPNLHDSEYILVDKVDYMIHKPERGDVVVFRAVAAGAPDRDFIKRVIGLPGETVQVRANHHVYINGHMLQEPYTVISPNYTWGPEKVPSNDYFVLGDHRSNSDDSHLWPSTWLQRQDIIGKALIAYWPPKDAELIRASPHLATGR